MLVKGGTGIQHLIVYHNSKRLGMKLSMQILSPVMSIILQNAMPDVYI